MISFLIALDSRKVKSPAFGVSRSNTLVLYFQKTVQESLPQLLDRIPSILAFSVRPTAAKRASPSAFLISSPTKEGRDARVARLGKDESPGSETKDPDGGEKKRARRMRAGDHLPGRNLKRQPRICPGHE